MNKEDALKAITIIPAELFGVSDRMGSIEVGKSANLFVCNGDAQLRLRRNDLWGRRRILAATNAHEARATTAQRARRRLKRQMALEKRGEYLVIVICANRHSVPLEIMTGLAPRFHVG